MFGGSFNPVHNGHLHAARLILTQTDFTRILFVPLHRPSHKLHNGSATAEDRLAMLRLALSDLDTAGREVLIEECELKRGGLSYTIDTVDYLYETYAVLGKIGIVIGDDLVPGLYSWHRWAELKEKVLFIILSRNKGLSEAVPPPGCSCVELKNPVVELSSSRIRNLVARGGSAEGMVPDEVAEYIRRNRLYLA
jgi:nicotinate-nucleotide adenylyltransferase